MKYMLMMHAPKGKGDWEILNWPPQDIKAHIDFMHRLNKELRDAAELVGGEGLGIANITTPPGGVASSGARASRHNVHSQTLPPPDPRPGTLEPQAQRSSPSSAPMC
jgi:hypothetical protein